MRTPVSFQYLIDELDHGGYTGCAFMRFLQDILTSRSGRHAELASAAALPPPAPRIIGGGGGRFGGGGGGRGGGRTGGGGGMIVPRGRLYNDRDGEVIPNPHPIQRLRILSGETRKGCAGTWPYPP